MDLRYTYWQMVDPKPVDDRTIPIFLIGKVLHGFVLGALDGKTIDLNVTDEGSSWNEELKFWYSPDWDKGEVAEFKSSRSFKEPTDIDDVSTYLEQILIYMVSKDVLTAKLWILYLNLKDSLRRTSPEFRAYTVNVTRDDLNGVKEYLRAARDQLLDAVERRDPGSLPLCRDFKCGAGRCAWWDSCKPEGRYGTPRWGSVDSSLPVPSEIPRAAKATKGPRAKSGRKRKPVVDAVLSSERVLHVSGNLQLDAPAGGQGEAESPQSA